ncbi:ATP-binding protein [Halovenus sp. HT40]|uniref:ATP-binding protein n=1 Tax=Halovenus sp. HT40 TaxID=3126691 RepID=UPI00300F3A84
MTALPVALDLSRIVTALLVVLVAGYAARYRGSPVADAFLWSLLSLSLWAVFLLVPGTFLLPSGPSVWGWTLVELSRVATSLIAPVLFYVYVRLYTGHNRYTERRKIGILLAPLGGAILLVASVLFARDLLPSVVLGVIPATIVLVYLYVTALLLLAVYLLVRLSQRYREVSTAQVASLAVGVVAPYVFVFVNSLTEPTEGGTTVSLLPVDTSFVGFLIAAVAVTYAIRSYPLFRPLPGAEYIAREEVIENLADGIVILDRDERIIDLNATALRIAQHADDSPIGRPIASVFENLSRLPPGSVRRVDLQTPDGPRQFEVTATPIQTGEDGSAGTTVRFRDITERKTREQQLQVLTRVLRHNLRNDLDTALAYTNEIADPEIRARLRSQVEGLLAMGEKARDVEAVLSKANESRSVIALDDLIQTVAERVEGEYEGVDIECPDDVSVSIRSHRELLDRLLTELIENGIEHNDDPSPRITIAVESPTEDTVEIEIADNGPGIPDHERQVIESGGETQLAHGAGLGLWLSNWIAESLGGELLFPSDRPGGVVVVRLQSV